MTRSLFLCTSMCWSMYVRVHTSVYSNACGAYVLLCPCALKALFVLPLCVCVCVQDPGRAAQPPLGGRRQVHRARPSPPRPGRHPRLCGLHHGVCRQRAPAGAQSGAGITGHPRQVCASVCPSPLGSSVSLQDICSRSQTLSKDFKRFAISMTAADFFDRLKKTKRVAEFWMVFFCSFFFSCAAAE